MIPTWWTQYPVDNNLITGWVGGPGAKKLSAHTNEQLLEIGISSLSHIFDISADEMREKIKQSFVFNWLSFAESLGAYSYSTPESKNARKLLNTPLAGSVFFAGEGLYDGEYSGTVEAALDSGQKAAAKLLKTLG